MSTEAKQVTCRKAIHNPAEGGYLHGPDDDTPYTVDGVEFCGRCHRALPEHEYGEEVGPSTEAKIKHTMSEARLLSVADVLRSERAPLTAAIIEECVADLRRLLEAGEGLAEEARRVIKSRRQNYEPMSGPYATLALRLAAYQEAAKS